VCRAWPAMEVRSQYTNTLITHMKKAGKTKFTHGDTTMLRDQEKCERTLKSLERIASNHYKSAYPRKADTSYTGLSTEKLSGGIDELIKSRMS